MAEESEELAMIAEKARALLNRQERQVLRRVCAAYTSGQMDVHHFVDALLRLLPTPDKATFLVELRELVREEDHGEYDYRVFALRRPFRTVQFQSTNSLDFEESVDPHQCLLQVERRPHHVVYSASSNNTSIIMREPHRIPRVKHKEMMGSSEEPIIRMGLHEMKIPFVTPDLSSAFPISTIINKEPSSSSSRVIVPNKNGPAFTSSSKKIIKPKSDDELIEVVIKKTNNILGIAIEGGNNTRHPLPRIIGIDGKGTAFEAAGLRIGQTILEVDGKKMEGLSHDKAARLIASAYADRSVPQLKLILTASTFRPNANYQPEN